MEYFRIFPRPSPNELGEREEGWQLAMRERPQPGTGIGEVGNREGEWQLGDVGQDAAKDSNWPSQGRGTGRAACDQGTAPARDRNWRAREQGRGMAVLRSRNSRSQGQQLAISGSGNR